MPASGSCTVLYSTGSGLYWPHEPLGIPGGTLGPRPHGSLGIPGGALGAGPHGPLGIPGGTLGTGPRGPLGIPGGHWGPGLMGPWDPRGGHWGPGLMGPWGSQGAKRKSYTPMKAHMQGHLKYTSMLVRGHIGIPRIATVRFGSVSVGSSSVRKIEML